MNISAPKRPDERGASAVEYAMLLSGIALLVVIVIGALGGQLLGLFTDTCTIIDAQTARAGNC